MYIYSKRDFMTIFSGMFTAFCCYESGFYTSFVLQMNFYKEECWDI